MARRRRQFEIKVFERQLAKISQNPDTTREAIRELQQLGSIPTASSDGAKSVMRQLATFPEGAGIAQLGYRIFKWLLVLTVVMTACLVMYGWVTYPSDAEVNAAVGAEATAEARTAAYTQLLSEWLQHLKDLGQLFLLTPVFPLIGTVIGYIFGVRRNNPEPDPEPDDDGGGAVAPGSGTTASPGKPIGPAKP